MAPILADSSLKDALTWKAEELSSSLANYTIFLEQSDCEEVKAAVAQFQSQGLGFRDVSPDTFHLPKLGARLATLSQELYNGKGFVVISGLNIDMLSPYDATLIYLGVTSYVGDKQAVQNGQGDVMIHVTDAPHWKGIPEENKHGIHSQKALPFHCDMGADILSLQSRACAASGGHTILASAWNVYEDLKDNKPEALETLLKADWPVQTTGDQKYFLAPLMKVYGDKLLTSVDPARLGPQAGSTKTEGQGVVPELTQKQLDALNALDESAKSNEISLSLQKGDILFLNNWAIFHRREAYVDGGNTARHLVRLWTRSTELGWEIPESMATPWSVAYERDTAKVYHIEPAEEYKLPKYNAGSAAFVIES